MISVLDHGYVRLVESWGGGDYGEQPRSNPDGTDEYEHEAGIIEAARQSTQGSFRGWEKDEKLLKFLYDNKHASPFEFAGMVIEVQAPIMVFREWHRHRTQSYNEMSGRYTELPDLYYIPSLERIMEGRQATINKQSSEGGITLEEAEEIRGDLLISTLRERTVYERLLARGLSRELARLIIPVNQYSRMRASANLRNWLAFLTLRQAPNAQYEIRQYANAVAEAIKTEFPRTYTLFMGGE